MPTSDEQAQKKPGLDASEIEMGGKKVPLDKVQKVYEDMQSEYTRVNQRLADLEKKSEELRKIQERYEVDPGFAEAFDQAWERPVPQETAEKIRRDKQMEAALEENRRLKLDQTFQSLQAKGFEITDEMREAVEARTRENPYLPPRAAFFDLYGEEIIGTKPEEKKEEGPPPYRPTPPTNMKAQPDSPPYGTPEWRKAGLEKARDLGIE